MAQNEKDNPFLAGLVAGILLVSFVVFCGYEAMQQAEQEHQKNLHIMDLEMEVYQLRSEVESLRAEHSRGLWWSLFGSRTEAWYAVPKH